MVKSCVVYNLFNCWPTTVDAIDLAFDTNDAIEEFGVTFRFNYMTVFKLEVKELVVELIVSLVTFLQKVASVLDRVMLERANSRLILKGKADSLKSV